MSLSLLNDFRQAKETIRQTSITQRLNAASERISQTSNQSADRIRQSANNVGDTIRRTGEQVKQTLKKIPHKVSANTNLSLPKSVISALESICSLPSKISAAISSLVRKSGGGIVKFIKAITDGINSLLQAVYDGLSSIFSAIRDTINSLNAFLNNMLSFQFSSNLNAAGFNVANEYVSIVNIINDFWNSLSDALQIHMPNFGSLLSQFSGLGFHLHPSLSFNVSRNLNLIDSLMQCMDNYAKLEDDLVGAAGALVSSPKELTKGLFGTKSSNSGNILTEGIGLTRKGRSFISSVKDSLSVVKDKAKNLEQKLSLQIG